MDSNSAIIKGKWIAANGYIKGEHIVLNAGYWRNFTENFAQAVTENQYFPKSKSGEYMISVYDFYSESEVSDVVVFAKGTIESPIISKIVKIDFTEDIDIEAKRSELYAIERKGIRRQIGEVFIYYNKSDFVSERKYKRDSTESIGNNNGFNSKRSRSEIKANPITQFNVNEKENTVTYTYKNGETVTESISTPEEAKESGKASREIDTKYLDAVNRGDMETAQRMVDEAAKKAGYSVRGLHATNAEFTEFDISKTSENNFHGKGIYFTNSVKDIENNYENYEGPDPWQKIEGRAYEIAYDKYGISYEDTLTSDPEIIGKLNECFDEAIDEFKKTGRRITAYLRFENPLILEKGMQIPYDYSGYDGIIDKQVYENIGHSGMDKNTIHYVVFNPNNIKSADPITYDDKGNIIPLSERFNPKNSDIRYSREIDSLGNELSKEQTEYFKDSKVRDENGNLLVVYHGTPKENGEFYVFDYNKAKRKGGFGFESSGKGFYFTTKKEAAEIYTRSGGRLLSVYVDIKNPYIVNGDIKEQISKDFGIDPLNVHLEEVRSILSSKGYDGIIKGKGAVQTVVVYYPEQIKLTSNKNPTADPDIRYSREFSTEDIYTSTADFKREVAPEDQKDFPRKLANKTTGIPEGETRDIYIYSAKKIYLFRADGYMHGEMIESLTPSKYEKIIKARKDYKNGIDSDRKTLDLWIKPISNSGRRSRGDISVLERSRGSASNDLLSKNSSSSDSTRNSEREWKDTRTQEEYDEIVNKLLESLGIDPVEYEKQHEKQRRRAFRELDTIEYTENKTEEVKTPSNRELLINALEGVTQNEAERKKLADYKSNLDNLNRESEKLSKLKKEIKELTFGKGNNKLYVIIILEKIKMTEVSESGNTETGVTQNSRSVNSSIAQIFGKINPLGKFFENVRRCVSKK